VNKYELVVIIDGNVGDEEVSEAYERLVRKPIEARGGEVGEVDQWGRRKLAYPIQRRLEGSYSVTKFTLKPTETKELEQGLRISEEVLRHLLIRADE
jgi:small subunit ribosomal protein S6